MATPEQIAANCGNPGPPNGPGGMAAGARCSRHRIGFRLCPSECPDRQKQLALLMRYETMHERAFYRALNELRTARKERRNEEIGFASQELKLQTAIRARKALELKEQAFEFKKQCWQERKTPPPTPKTVETVSQILPAADCGWEKQKTSGTCRGFPGLPPRLCA